jgi:hypothetical protein
MRDSILCLGVLLVLASSAIALEALRDDRLRLEEQSQSQPQPQSQAQSQEELVHMHRLAKEGCVRGYQGAWMDCEHRFLDGTWIRKRCY